MYGYISYTQFKVMDNSHNMSTNLVGFNGFIQLKMELKILNWSQLIKQPM